MTETPFIHLHTHSAYSLAEGAIPVKDLIKLCKKENMPAVAVTDTNNLFGAMEFAKTAKSSGIQPILGCQVSLGLEEHQLVILVQSESGYRNICKLISEAYLSGESHEAPHTNWESLEELSKDLICLSGGLRGPIGQYLLHRQSKAANEVTKRLKKIFKDRFYIELQRHGLSEEDQIEEELIELAYKYDIPLVATNDCYFAKRDMVEAHDALLCIADGRYISEEDRRKETEEHYFKSTQEMIDLFSDLPEAINNTNVIAKRCHYLLKEVAPLLPPFESEDGSHNEVKELREQSKDGLQMRLENFVFEEGQTDKEKEEIAKPYWDRLTFEMDIIEQMGFPGYFLIVSDFIKWAKSKNIPVGPGRGSGAGSVVAWALKITDLDPLRFGLLFERFLNPERVSMPDFDVDFCQERRDEVIKYVQEKYGYDHVAQIITFGKLQARAVVRDVGRVLQMPYGQVDRLAKMIPANPANPVTLAEALEQDPDLRLEIKKDETSDKLITIALQLEGLYRHASTHAAGVVIGDRPLHKLLPLYRDPRSDMPVTQYNMKFVEGTGLVKFDFLGLKTLTVVQKAVENIEKSDGQQINILQIPLDDKKTYDLLSSGNTSGVFQLESAGMRDVLRKMQPNRFEDIIALVSLYRPGPMDNIPKYISVKDGEDEPDYLHPKLQPILEETFGIMIYQEQVMQAAQRLAGYTLGGADLLRRAMGKKIIEEMDKQRQKFKEGAKENNGVDEEQSDAIFDQIAKFAGYGFNKSHAAAYALIAYQTAWLKANYPVEFMAATMTLDKGNTDKLAMFKQELDRMQIRLLTPDLNMSGPDFNVEEGAVRYALSALKGVGDQAMHNLCEERKINGPYKDLSDFINRLDPKTMNRKQFEMLSSAGTFDSVTPDRARVRASADLLLQYAHNLAEEKAAGQNSLFGEVEQGAGLGVPELAKVNSWDPLEKLRYEFDAIGFYLSAHPLDTKKEQLSRLEIKTNKEIEDALRFKHTGRFKMAGILIKKQEKVSQSGNKYAFLQLSDSSGVYEVVLFSELLSISREFLIAGEALLLSADAELRDEQMRYTVQRITPLESSLAKEVKEVTISVNKEQAFSIIHEHLSKAGHGRVKIQFYLELDDLGAINLNLPGSWAFTPEKRNEFYTIHGITNIQER